MKSNTLAEPILVGRERELEELRHYLKLTTEGKGTTIFISGEAGCGKTRLSAEFLNIAKKEGVMILAGWCLSNSAQPYFPFVEAFESYYSKVDSGIVQQREIRSWLSGGSQADREITPQLWKDRTFAAITKELVYMSTGRPIILFIDDLQWADSASLALLHYIARAITSERILVIATFRKEEVNAKFEGRPQPLAEVLRIMAREELFEETKLQNLSQANVSRIAEDMLRGRLGSEFAQKLSEESHGNPLFVVETLRMMHSQGSLVQEHSKWHIRNGTVEIPSKVKEIIMRRLEALTANERRILDAASVVGEKFNPKLVSAILAQDNIEVLEALNDATKSTLLVFCEGNHCQFKHTKIQEMIYEAIPPILKKEYHSRIAEKIETTNQGLDGPIAGDLAYHYHRAENKEKAIEYSLAAGKYELKKWSNVQAIKHFTYVIEAVGEDPERVIDRESALNGLANALYTNSLYIDAERAFEELASTTQNNTVKLRALRMAMYSAFSLGDNLKLAELMKKVESFSSFDPLENARVLMLKGRVFTLRQNLLASIKCNRAALRAFEEQYSLGDIAICLLSIGTQRVVIGELEGLADSLFAVALFGELESFNQQMIACYLAGDSFSNCLLLAEALDMYGRIAEIYERTKVGNYSAFAFGYAFSSQIFECLGELEKALSYSLKALEVSNKTDSSVTQGVIFCHLAIEYSLLGNLKLAEEYFKKLVKLPPEIRSHYFVRELVAKATLFASKNQWEESNQCFNEFLESLEHSPGSNCDKFWVRQIYAWALERQGSFDKSKVLRKQAKQLYNEINEKFEQANLRAKLYIRKQGIVGEKLEMCLLIVNLAKNRVKLFKVEGLLPFGCHVVSLPSFCSIQEGSILMDQKSVEPFQVENLTLKIAFSKADVYHLNPILSFVNHFGEAKINELNPVIVTVELASSEDKVGSPPESFMRQPHFKSEATEKAYSFLVSAFQEDYIKKRLPLEKSGWRTLMEIKKNAEISKHSMYGQSGRGGEVPAELGHLGLVESRFFSGERGRGGRVLKTRIRQNNAEV